MFTTARIEKKAISKLLPILTDVDGVLLEWEPAFTKWMNSKGYEVQTEGVYKQSTRFGIDQELSDQLTNRFNESAWMGYLKPIPGAVKWLERFEDEGYFECLTIVRRYPRGIMQYNLEMLFGKVITECTCIATAVTKTSIKEMGSNVGGLKINPKML